MARFGLADNDAETRDWLAKTKADALIFVVRPPDEKLWMLRAVSGLKIMVTLATPTPDLPGMDMCEGLVATSAVDLVVAQLHRNERGVPAHPTTLLLEGGMAGVIAGLNFVVRLARSRDS